MLNEQKPPRKTHPNIDAIHTAGYAKFAEKILDDMQAGELPDPLQPVLDSKENIKNFEDLHGQVAESIEIAREIFEPVLIEQLGGPVEMTLPTIEQLLARKDLDWTGLEEAYALYEQLGNDPLLVMVPTKIGKKLWQDLFKAQGVDHLDIELSREEIEDIQTDGANLDTVDGYGFGWICSVYPMQAQSNTITVSRPSDEAVRKLPIYPEYLTAELYQKHTTGSFAKSGESSITALRTKPNISNTIGLRCGSKVVGANRPIFGFSFSYYVSSNGRLAMNAEAHRPVRLESIVGGKNA